jgi:peptidase inhibitor I78 family protein
MKHLIFIGLLGLAACSTAPPAKEASAAPSDPTADACGAKAMQRLVGRPRSEVPVPVKPELQRVACTTCAVTMDFNPERLNFFFDEKTGIIKEVRCG